MHTVLLALFNMCLGYNTIPDDWRSSHITLLPKNEAGMAGDPSKQRPISVASILYRAYTWILAKRLLDAGSDYIPYAQRAYRRHGSCHDILEILDSITYESSEQPVYLLKTDIAKAFDSVQHQGIIDQMALVGIPMKFSATVADLLTGLNAHIHTENGLSPSFPIRRGIRQGCPLSHHSYS